MSGLALRLQLPAFAKAASASAFEIELIKSKTFVVPSAFILWLHSMVLL